MSTRTKTSRRLLRGIRKESAGQLDAAIAIYKEAASSGDLREAASGCLNLGNLHYRQGHLQEAIRWYQQALDADEPEVSPLAATVLAEVWFFIFHDATKARDCLSVASRSRSPDVLARAYPLFEYLNSPEMRNG